MERAGNCFMEKLSLRHIPRSTGGWWSACKAIRWSSISLDILFIAAGYMCYRLSQWGSSPTQLSEVGLPKAGIPLFFFRFLRLKFLGGRPVSDVPGFHRPRVTLRGARLASVPSNSPSHVQIPSTLSHPAANCRDYAARF